VKPMRRKYLDPKEVRRVRMKRKHLAKISKASKKSNRRRK